MPEVSDCKEIDIALNEAFFGDIDFARPQIFNTNDRGISAK